MLKKLGSLKNPQQKLTNFKCDSCGISWIKPVNYFIQSPHPAIAKLIEPYEKKVCKKCASGILGSKNKHKKEFFV